MKSKVKQKFHILLVEDNPDDAYLTRMAFEESQWDVEIHAVEDGEEALLFLEKQDKYRDTPVPHLVLLDLNLPRLPGCRVLEQMKNHARLREIPVVVLTTSTNESDIRECYRNHANGYVNKPVDLEEFMAMARVIENYWFSVVTLPVRK